MFDQHLNSSTVPSATSFASNSTAECTSSILSLTVQSGVLVWVALDGILFVAIVCGNLVTLYVLCTSLQYNHLVSNRFVLSLAISDTMVGSTLLYHMAFYLAPELAACKITCLLRFVLILLASCASIINLLAIAIDRYLAILHPFTYESTMTNRRAHLVLGGGWLLALLISTVPLYWNTWRGSVDVTTPMTSHSCHELGHILPPSFTTRLLAPAFCLVWATMCVIYWRIWREAVHQAYKLRRSNVSQLRKSCLKVVLTIMGSFTVTWLPLLAIVLLQQATDNRITPSAPSPALYRCALALAYSGSAINPLIYAWKNTEFRRTFGHMVRCRTASHSLHNERSSIVVGVAMDYPSYSSSSKAPPPLTVQASSHSPPHHGHLLQPDAQSDV